MNEAEFFDLMKDIQPEFDGADPAPAPDANIGREALLAELAKLTAQPSLFPGQLQNLMRPKLAAASGITGSQADMIIMDDIYGSPGAGPSGAKQAPPAVYEWKQRSLGYLSSDFKNAYDMTATEVARMRDQQSQSLQDREDVIRRAMHEHQSVNRMLYEDNPDLSKFGGRAGAVSMSMRNKLEDLIQRY